MHKRKFTTYFNPHTSFKGKIKLRDTSYFRIRHLFYTLWLKLEHFLILIVKKKRLSTLFRTFALTFVSLSRHFGKRRALLILAFTIKFSQNLNAQKGRGCNNAHVTDIYYPERENYILALREWLLLILLCGQCEKPDCRDKQNTFLTLFAFINFSVPKGDEEQRKFL